MLSLLQGVVFWFLAFLNAVWHLIADASLYFSMHITTKYLKNTSLTELPLFFHLFVQLPELNALLIQGVLKN